MTKKLRVDRFLKAAFTINNKNVLEKLTGSKDFPTGIGHWFYEMQRALEKDSGFRAKLGEDLANKILADIKKTSLLYYEIFSKIPDNLDSYSSTDISPISDVKAFARMLESVTKDLVLGLKTVDSSGRSILSLIKYPTSAVSKYLNFDFIE